MHWRSKSLSELDHAQQIMQPFWKLKEKNKKKTKKDYFLILGNMLIGMYYNKIFDMLEKIFKRPYHSFSFEIYLALFLFHVCSIKPSYINYAREFRKS